jgi:hypothetical protein
MVQIGREQMPPQAAEDIARAIYANASPRLVPSLDFTGKYERMQRRLYPGSDVLVELDAHREPRIQAVVELKRERASAQNIDRLRLMYPDERKVRIEILCNLPLPGIKPDEFLPIDQILSSGTRIERAIATGLVTKNAAVMRAEFSYVSENAARHDIKLNSALISQAIENKAKVGDAHRDYICEAALCLKNNHLAGGEFRHHRPGSVPPVWSDFGFNPDRPGRRRIDITIARHYGAKHVNEIEFRGHAADALERSRAMDHKLNRMPSLALYDTKTTPLDSREFWENVFAMSPTRVTRRMPDGAIVATWRTYDGKTIDAPIDAPPAPPAPPPVPTGMARIVDTDADGKTSVEWVNLPTRTGPHPLAALLAHRRQILAMSDDEILSAMADVIACAPEDRAALAQRVRAYAAKSSSRAAEVFQRRPQPTI